MSFVEDGCHGLETLDGEKGWKLPTWTTVVVYGRVVLNHGNGITGLSWPVGDEFRRRSWVPWTRNLNFRGQPDHETWTSWIKYNKPVCATRSVLTVIMNGWQKVIVRVASRPGVLFGLQNWVRGRTLFGVEIRKSEKMVSELRIVSLIFKKKDFGGLAMVTSGTNHVVSCKYIWYQSSQIFVRTSFDVYLPRMVALPFDLVPNASHTGHIGGSLIITQFFLKRKKMATTLKRLKFVRNGNGPLAMFNQISAKRD